MSGRLISVLAVCAAVLSPVTGRATETLTWMACVKEAAMKNPGILAAEKSLSSADYARKSTYGALLPQITGSMGWSRSYIPRSDNEVMVNGYSSSSGGGSVYDTSFGSYSTRSEYSSTYTLSLELQQQIFDGFRTKGNIDQAKAQMNVSVAKLLTEKSLVSYELKSAFAQLLYAQELIGISQKIVEQRELNFRMVSLKYDVGRENKGSLLLSRANLRQAELDLKQARRTLEVSQRQLQTVMGRTLFGEVQAQGKLVTNKVPAKPDFSALALKTPSHFQQQATVSASKAGVTIAQSDFYPQIQATASYSSSDTSGYVAPNSWSVGVDGSLNVFDGAQTYFNVRSARMTLEQERANLKDTDATTGQTLAEDYQDYVNAVEQVVVSKETLEAAELRNQIAEAQYGNGLISFQDFNTITDSYITNQRTELQTRRDAVLAEAQWEQSQGLGAIP